MEFYFPDSQDQVDPSFDFITEQRSIHRVRQRDDRYAHEVIDPPPYDGLLISKPIVDGLPGTTAKYTEAQRNRLYRQGAKRFFRLDQRGEGLKIMGDCGAFTYVREHEPVYTVEEVLEFYEGSGLDLGVAMDHLIFGYDAELDAKSIADVPEEWRFRQNLTIELAAEFLQLHKARRCRFEPLAVAHGWSPLSYASAVTQLQRIGYDRIALGGMVPLKTPDILKSLKEVSVALDPAVQLHLLGITRTAHVHDFAGFGVTSFDSTSPFRQAFKDEKDNYYTLDSTFVAIRIPQVDGNTRLRRQVTAGLVDQRSARRLERDCLSRLRGYDRGDESLERVLDAICSYAELLGTTKDRTSEYRRTLEAKPWKRCRCTVCREIGVEVIIFRGADRNRRRGFHNLAVFSARLRRELDGTDARSQLAR
ncbi:MAG: queuine/other tRNA-ribosyltransferase [Acidimicrobiaceae bacterium]|nr:queuine/other tRNA-ribosyltransferase [Acidimicrobiaceae bacterium]MYE08228.1 queuine/other tRNA-ribosyltransferase [Acidimicrobiaceae bacterium]MYI36021.1 queuine/other tRNA-ribosyltransferase [Acidimicrobiaceae bacterium]